MAVGVGHIYFFCLLLSVDLSLPLCAAQLINTVTQPRAVWREKYNGFTVGLTEREREQRLVCICFKAT